MKSKNPNLTILFICIVTTLFSQNKKNLTLSYDKNGRLIERVSPAINLSNLSKPPLPSATAPIPDYKISPIPTSDYLSIGTDNHAAPGIIKSELYALSGQLIQSYLGNENQSAKLDVSHFIGGLYLLVITRQDQSQEIHKVIINE